MSDQEQEEMVSVPLSLVQDLADNHKELARWGYEKNKTQMADIHHSWARELAEADTREWSEVDE